MANETLLANLINPEVMADFINQKLTDFIKFSPLATIDRTLVGKPGDTITLPKYTYIGDAVDVEEGAVIPLSILAATTTSVTVKKAGKGISLSDEAVLSAYGDPVGEATNQIGISIAQKVDNDCLTALGTIKAAMTLDVSATSIVSTSILADALVKFGENIDDDRSVLLVAPAQLAQLRHDPDWINGSDISTDIMLRGSIGMIWGCEVQISNKIKIVTGKYTNYIIKPGALAIYLKRDVLVENDRVVKNQTNEIYATQHYTAYLLNESKAIKVITKSAEVA